MIKIAVCIKQVPGTTAVEVDPVTGNLKRDGVESKLNPCDLYALESALAVKGTYGGEITAVTMGPPQAKAVLREAFMMGVDKAVLVSDRKFGGSDVLATSYTLAQALKKCGPFDLIICGRQTTDGDTAQVGAELAEFCRIPHVGSVVRVGELKDNVLSLVSEMQNCRTSIDVTLPALIAVDESVGEPRLPSYRLKLATADREITELSLADFEDSDPKHYGQSGSPTRVVRIFPPEVDDQQEKWEGSGEECGARLFDCLESSKFLQ